PFGTEVAALLTLRPTSFCPLPLRQCAFTRQSCRRNLGRLGLFQRSPDALCRPVRSPRDARRRRSPAAHACALVVSREQLGADQSGWTVTRAIRRSRRWAVGR